MYPQGFEAVDIPEARQGSVSVDRFTVSEDAAKFDALRSMMSGGGRRGVPAGEYTRLLVGGQTMMSDTPDEARDHLSFYWAAEGDVLMNGLGLGFVLKAILSKPELESVTVIEVNQDVIDLVAPSYDDPRVTIIKDNALEWRPEKGRRFDAVWHDIWTNICSDNLPDMHKLHRAYGRRCDWQGSWARCEAEWAR